MNLGFQDGGTSGHEFGHAIGLAHEHQNPEGGIEWNEAEVIRDLSGSPNFWDEPTIRHNVLEKYQHDQIRGTRFDPDSIMLYAFPARWTRNGIATRANETLSATDRSFVAMVYPRTTGPVQPVSLGVGAAALSASIGKPGEEDLCTFVAEDGALRGRDPRTDGRGHETLRPRRPDAARRGGRRRRAGPECAHCPPPAARQLPRPDPPLQSRPGHRGLQHLGAALAPFVTGRAGPGDTGPVPVLPCYLVALPGVLSDRRSGQPSLRFVGRGGRIRTSDPLLLSLRRRDLAGARGV
jgi:hypothetical protein